MDLSDGNSLKLRCLDNSICFDASIQIIFCCENKEYVLLDDTLGYALSELKFHFFETETLELIPELLEVEIGKAQNEYYYCSAEDLPLEISAIREVNDRWIGSKYSCFESKNFSTWVYLLNGYIYLKITPLYSWHYDDEPEISYNDFMQNYKILYKKCLKSQEVHQCQEMIKKIIELMD